MLYSIIIPVKKINNYVKKNIQIINQINPKKLEIIVIVNKKAKDRIKSKISLKVIESGPCGPAIKRDIGSKIAKGSYLVFFDDDSFPRKDYFINLENIISKKKYEIFAGPAISPKKQSIKKRISDAFFLSSNSFGIIDRYTIGKEKIVDDWPSVNFIIKKAIFKKVGGFKLNYWPGEDTFLCDKIKKIKKNILYSPKLVVYHYRREGLKNHLKQIYGYGFHRGYFARKYRSTSLKFRYFIPSFFLLALLASLLSSFFNLNNNYLFLIIFSYSAYIFISIMNILRFENSFIAFNTVPYIFLSHITYGYSFLKGFLCFSNLLKSRNYLAKYR
jgi:GT2 family glycosyltransferase